MKKTATKIYQSLEKICAIVLSLIIFLSISSIEAKVVRGIVIDNATEKPITGSVVMLFAGKTIYGGAITDSTGLFAFDNVSLERFYIRVKRIGYKEAVTGPLLMSKLDTIKILVKLDVEEIQMNEIVIEAKRTDEWLEREGYNKRKEMGLGHYLKVDEIKGREFGQVTQILQSLPGIVIRQNPINVKQDKFGPEIYSSRSLVMGFGQVTIYIDGIQLNDNGSIDNLSPGDIAALEFYPSTSTAPAQYSMQAGGVLLIWTKK